MRNAPRRYAWVGLAAAAAVVVAIGVSLLRPEPATGPGVIPSASATPTATPRPTRSSPPDPFEGVPETRIEAEVIRVPGTETGYLSVTADAVWAAVSSGLVRIDPTTLEFEQIEQAPRFGMAASQDAVWATDFDGGTVSRFDPATNEGTRRRRIVGKPCRGGDLRRFRLGRSATWRLGRRASRSRPGSVVAEVPVGTTGGFAEGHRG